VRAAEAARSSAQVHESPARLHDRSADLGVGHRDSNRRLAREHREHAEADRVKALVDDSMASRYGADRTVPSTANRVWRPAARTAGG
jgi:hypothetical protein